MKIIYARTQFWFNLKSGGSVGHTLGVLNGLKENGCLIKIVSNERFFGIDGFDYSVVLPKFKRPLGEFFYNFYAKNKFKKEILNFKPDFIYHRYTSFTFFVSKIAKQLAVPLILEFNSSGSWTTKYWGRGAKKYLLYPIVKFIENYNIQNASLIVVVSQPLKEGLLALGVPENKILVNPNGVNQNKFNPAVKESNQCKKIKQDLTGNSDKVIVGFTGTFGVWHGIPQLVEAIDKILKQYPAAKIHFLLIGNGNLKNDAENKIGHYKDVTFTGEVPYSEIQNYLSVCDILVSPHCPQADGKEFFGSPTKLFEYMAMGKAIVASDLGQIGKVIKDGETAILVKPGNVEELIDGILKLVGDKDLREIGRRGQERNN